MRNKLILASQSPRRAELLTQIGVCFTTQAADIDETPRSGEAARAYVERLALEKARAVFAATGNNSDSVVLGSDTSVIVDGEILGKPGNSAEAHAMLSRLSGRSHQVLTAVALVGQQAEATAAEKVISVSTQVAFNALTAAQITDYIASGEPMDKAGSYGIQGFGAVLVNKIDGSYSNVVGLPLSETAALLRSFNIPIWASK